MKSMIVAFLAALVLTGCGVGMDDPEGEQEARGTSDRHLIADNPSSSQTEFRSSGQQDPRTALPQDPIPLFNSKTGPGLEPAGDPRPTK